MTEKTPINPTEIREGDTIRWEGDDERQGTRLAIEYIAHHDGDDRSWADDGGEYYLLKRFERPTSPVPNVDTLGYLHHGGRLILGVWRTHDYRPGMDGVGRSAIQWERDIPVDQVTGFTPAIAIPAAPSTHFLQQVVAKVPTSALRTRIGAVRAVLDALPADTRERTLAAQLDELDAADAAREAEAHQ